MANEIWCNYTTGATLYAIVRKQSDKKVYNGTTFEAWNNANIGTYDIPMTENGMGMYFVNFPVVAAGIYYVVICVQAGVNPAVTDTVIYTNKIDWSGTIEVDIGAKVDVIDGIVDDILVDTGTTLPASIAALSTKIESQNIYVYDES